MTPVDCARPKTQLVAVQIMRAAAAIAVFIYHLPLTPGAVEHGWGGGLFQIGANGVDLFFVISGFIMCYTTRSDFDVRTFVIKRLVRILPLYYALTLGVFAVALVAPQLLNSTTADVGDLVKSLLFIPYEKGNGLVQPMLFVGWTLNYEMFFYGVFAVALLAGRYRILVAAGVLAAVYLLGRFYDGDNVALRFFTSGIILEFLWGCAVFVVLEKAPRLIRRASKLWPLAVVLLLGQMVWEPDLPREISKGLPAAFLLACLLKVELPRTSVVRFFERLGDASYSLYLVHPYVIQAFVKLLLPLLGISVATLGFVAAASAAGAVTAALLLYRYLEAPSNTWLRRRLLPTRDTRVASA